jgi:hypothetical protein
MRLILIIAVIAAVFGNCGLCHSRCLGEDRVDSVVYLPRAIPDFPLSTGRKSVALRNG